MTQTARAPRLRRRLIVTLALVGALSSVSVAATSYLLVADARTDDARRKATDDGRFLLRLASDASPASDEDIEELLVLIGRRGASETVAVLNGRVHRTSVTIGPDHVPKELTDLVLRGRVGVARTLVSGDPYFVVGGQIEPSRAAFYFFFPLAQVENDLGALRNTAAGVAMAVVLLSALIGWASAAGLMRPIRRARDAAIQMQEGDLGTRLPDEGKGELAELAKAFNAMASTLQATLTSLTAAEAGQRRFVADVSHELRTPLTALSAAADVMEQNIAAMPPAAAKAAGLIIDESRRLRTLAEDLMEISRFDSGKIHMDLKKVDIERSVRSVLAARGWSDQVTLSIEPGTSVTADPRRLETIVANLIGNAMKHGQPPVSIAAVRTPSGIEMVFKDHGPGIPAELRDSVFERFYKADPARSRSDGSGLGLAIAKQNAEAHGGTLSIEERDGATCFVLYLPSVR